MESLKFEQDTTRWYYQHSICPYSEKQPLPINENTPSLVIPRMALSELNANGAGKLNALMEKHSFIILTNIGKCAFQYEKLVKELTTFFTKCPETERKEYASRSVYKNEMGTPMWYRGYEKTDVRGAFRVHAGQPHLQKWPTEAFEKTWMTLLNSLQKICDQSLKCTLPGQNTVTAAMRNKYCNEDDFSVCYALFYPNTAGSGQSEEENVYEHVDPSLYVVEPVCSVPGLEVLDQATKQWISVEECCESGKEIVLFCGKALERATEGRIKGTWHRVRRHPQERICFLYEQKYQEFFEE